MHPKYLKYFDTLEIQLPAAKFIKDAKGALLDYGKKEGNFDRYLENVRLLMYLDHFTVESLSIKAGFNRSYLGRLIRKDFDFHSLTIHSLRKLAGALNIRPGFLLTGDVRKLMLKAIPRSTGLSAEDRATMAQEVHDDK